MLSGDRDDRVVAALLHHLNIIVVVIIVIVQCLLSCVAHPCLLTAVHPPLSIAKSCMHLYGSGVYGSSNDSKNSITTQTTRNNTHICVTMKVW